MSPLDTLEARRLFAAPFIGKTGTLNVIGSGTADTIVVSEKDGRYLVSATTGDVTDLSSFDADQVKRIAIDARGGNDRVTIEAGVAERATVLGGAGNDRIDVANFAAVSINGGSGDDRIRHVLAFDAAVPDASATASRTIRVATVVGITVLSGEKGPESYASNSIIEGGAGDDVVTAGAAGDNISGGSGDDRVVLRPGIRSTTVAGYRTVTVAPSNVNDLAGSIGTVLRRDDATLFTPSSFKVSAATLSPGAPLVIATGASFGVVTISDVETVEAAAS